MMPKAICKIVFKAIRKLSFHPRHPKLNPIRRTHFNLCFAAVYLNATDVCQRLVASANPTEHACHVVKIWFISMGIMAS